MALCKNCGNTFPDQRKDLGYSVCVTCSTESKWSGVPVVHHKTGNEIQVVKDPDVAAEFIAKSSRCGFGTLKGMVGSWKKPTSPSLKKKTITPTKPSRFNVVIGTKEIVTNYQDEELAPKVLEKLDIDGKEVARSFLESEFQSMKISPVCRKQLLHLIDNS